MTGLTVFLILFLEIEDLKARMKRFEAIVAKLEIGRSFKNVFL